MTTCLPKLELFCLHGQMVWRFGAAETVLGVSTKLLYVEPGYYWDGWPSLARLCSSHSRYVTQANSAWPSLRIGRPMSRLLAMVSATARKETGVLRNSRPSALLLGLLTYWSSRLKSLADNRAGHPADVGRMLTYLGLTLAGSKHRKRAAYWEEFLFPGIEI